MDLNTILEIKKELHRFNIRLKAVEDRWKKDPYCKHRCKENGALKRAALDLKQELNKIIR